MLHTLTCNAGPPQQLKDICEVISSQICYAKESFSTYSEVPPEPEAKTFSGQNFNPTVIYILATTSCKHNTDLLFPYKVDMVRVSNCQLIYTCRHRAHSWSYVVFTSSMEV